MSADNAICVKKFKGKWHIWMGFMSDDNWTKVNVKSSVYKCFDSFSDAIMYAYDEINKDYYEYGIQILTKPVKIKKEIK